MSPKLFPIRDGVTFVQRVPSSSKRLLPFFGTRLRAGFPSPADDYIEGKIDLNKYLVQHEAATFLVRIDGDSMTGAGIFPGDIAIVDRSLVTPDIQGMNGKIVLAVLDGEFTIKRLCVKGRTVSLVPENDKYQPIPVSQGSDFTIWGVVKHSIRHF
jgi:DNA polymerase V